MIPVVATVFSTALRASTVLTLAGTAGMGVAIGQKYGRKACEFLDRMEDRFRLAFQTQQELE